MNEIDKLNWKTFESITKYLGRQTDVVVKGYGRDCKITGKSRVQHQIDVLTSYSDGTHSYETAIECKYWSKKVNKDIVMKLSSIMEDAGISKGIIVTNRDFNKDGQDYANLKTLAWYHYGNGMKMTKRLS